VLDEEEKHLWKGGGIDLAWGLNETIVTKKQGSQTNKMQNMYILNIKYII
jgi:hypothetical protein